MNKHLSFILSLFFILLATGCTRPEEAETPARLDGDSSRYTPKAAMDIYDQEPRQALRILDSAVLLGNVKEDLAMMLKARVYSQSTAEQHLDTAWQLCEDLMERDYVEDPSSREEVLDLLVSITRRQKDYEQCMRWATEKADLCRRLGEKTEALRTEAEIGSLLANLGEEEKGLEKLTDVIAALDGQRKLDEMDACIIAIKRKINVLQSLGRENEVIPLAQHILEILSDYRQNADNYEDNSYRMVNEQPHVEKYCNFYSAQAHGYLAQAYAVTADKPKAPSTAKRLARKHLSLFEQSDFGRSLGGRQAATTTWLLLGDYDKMLATYDELAAQMGNDTLNVDYLEMLNGHARVAEARGDIRTALDYQKQYAAVGHKLNRHIHRSQAHEYAVRYHLQEERRNTEREHAARQRTGMAALFLGALAMTFLTFIFIFLHQLKDIRQKNAVLTKEISERIDYEEKYLQLVGGGEYAADNTRKQGLPTPREPLPPQELEALSDKELFEYIRTYITESKLHLDMQFGRQQLMDLLHLSKDRIGAAFVHGSDYKSISDFLNDIRLVYSTKILTEQPEMTVAEVAIASGFSNAVVFSRNFKQRFAITPSEFRKKQ